MSFLTLDKLKNYGLPPLLLSGAVAASIAGSVGFSHQDGWSVPGWLECALWLALWIVLYAVFFSLYSLLKRCCRRQRAPENPDTNTDASTNASTAANTDVEKTAPLPQLAAVFSPRRIFFRLAIIFACWLPILIAVYPGILFNDTIIQLAQWFGEPMYGYSSISPTAAYSDHHPVFLMLVYGLIVQAGWALFGDPNAGLFSLVVVEALVTAAAYGFALNYLERIGAPRLLVRVLFIAWCAFPLFGWFTAIPVKDTAFSWLYLLFCISVYKVCAGFFGQR